MKLWEKGQGLDARIEKYTVGKDPELDLELVESDCRASIAHVKMLHAIGILNSEEARKLEEELKRIITLHREKKFIIRIEDEDGHTAIENHLIRKLGQTGKKIHTGRSRNDQVLVAIRLYSRDKFDQIRRALQALIKSLTKMGVRYRTIPIPGYTHFRKAMPFSVGRHFEAFKEALQDDLRLLNFVSRLTDQNPLGSAAGYGTTLRLDRRLTTRLLGFRRTQRNELYAQNSRGKFESIILAVLSQTMLDLARLATDLILFSTEEFGFFQLPDRFTTGSSLMPQKKNPDVLELVRANSALVHSGYLQVIETLKGLPSGYHRDLQLTKEPLLRGFKKTLETLEIMSLVLENLKICEDRCREACRGDIRSADRIHELVKKGVPFRDAYRRVAQKYD
ncbi:MAG: argininosuccinate lyase [Candidatus Aminicenantales bacterium]